MELEEEEEVVEVEEVALHVRHEVSMHAKKQNLTIDLPPFKRRSRFLASM